MPMLSFRRFLNEAASTKTEPFRAFPQIEVQSLDDFVKDPTADKPATRSVAQDGLAEAPTVPNPNAKPKKVIPRLPDPNDTHEYGDNLLGAITASPSDEEVQAYFKRIVQRSMTRKDYVVGAQVHRSLLQVLRRDAVSNQTQIIIPQSQVAIDLESGDYIDVETLKQRIKQRPEVGGILTVNGKMKKSGRPNEYFVNIGIPALRGLIVDERTNEFRVINTCPGAGNCQLICFARKASYIQYAEVSQKLMRVLNFLLNDPKGFFAQVTQEIGRLIGSKAVTGKELVVRWHDAGDFFSPEYTNAFFAMARRLPHVRFYAYTKIAAVATNPQRPANFMVNFSGGAKPGEERQIDFTKVKHSMVVPEKMFSDIAHIKGGKWQFKNAQGKAIMAQRLADEYGIDPTTVITYEEMMQKDIDYKTPHKWNVIIMSGDGDDSAARPDVLGTYLFIH